MTSHRRVHVCDHRRHDSATPADGLVPSPTELIAASDRVVVPYVTALAQHASRADRDDPLVEADHIIDIASLEQTFIVIVGHYSATYRITRQDWLRLGVPAAVLHEGGMDE